MAMRRSYYKEPLKPSSEPSSSDESGPFIVPLKRRVNIYESVEGKVTQAGLIANIRDVKASKQPLRPDEVLFNRVNAPIRYEETDYYHAHANLPADQKLPDSDLLSAIHAYVSKLYLRTAEPGSDLAWKCMDETALLAFGILMEETARGVLNETGHLAFTEAADEEEERILAMGDKEEVEDDEASQSLSRAENAESESSESDSSSDNESVSSMDMSD